MLRRDVHWTQLNLLQGYYYFSLLINVLKVSLTLATSRNKQTFHLHLQHFYWELVPLHRGDQLGPCGSDSWCWSVCSAIWGFLLYQNRLRWPSDLHPSIHSCWQWVCPDLWPLTLERLKVFFLLTFWSKLSSPDIRNIYCSLQPGRIVPLQLNPWCPLSALASVPSFFGDYEFKQSISFLTTVTLHPL